MMDVSAEIEQSVETGTHRVYFYRSVRTVVSQILNLKTMQSQANERCLSANALARCKM